MRAPLPSEPLIRILPPTWSPKFFWLPKSFHGRGFLEIPTPHSVRLWGGGPLVFRGRGPPLGRKS